MTRLTNEELVLENSRLSARCRELADMAGLHGDEGLVDSKIALLTAENADLAAKLERVRELIDRCDNEYDIGGKPYLHGTVVREIRRAILDEGA